MRRVALLCGLAVLATYAGMPAEELTFDNAFIIGDDTRLRLFTAESLAAIFRFDYWWPSMASNLYRPLTTLSFWFEYSFLGYGEAPLGYQLGNLALHWLNAVLLYLLGRRLRLDASWACFAALVYAIHPVATETVANIVGRSDLIATATTLGGLICYFTALSLPKGAARTKQIAWSGVWAFVGVMAKENAIVLPALIAGHGLLRLRDWSRGGQSRELWVHDAWRAALVLLPAAIFFLISRYIFSSYAGVTDHPFIDNPLIAEDFLTARLSALGVWGMQLWTLFVPFGLSNDYSFNAIPAAELPFGNATAWWAWGTLVFFCVVAYAAWKSWRRGSDFGWLCLSYVVAMLPTSNLLILIGSIRAERFHYLPSVFFWLGLMMAAAWWWNREAESPNDEGSVARRTRSAAVAMAAGWTVCLLVLAHVRCYDWRSNLNLWSSALATQPGSAKVRSASGNAKVIARQTEENEKAAIQGNLKALAIFRNSQIPLGHWPLQTYSDLLASYINLYDAARQKGQKGPEVDQLLDSALAAYAEAAKVDEAVRRRWTERYGDQKTETVPLLDVLHRNHAVALSRKGRYEEALRAMDEVMTLLPLKAKNWTALAEIHEEAGKYQEALEKYVMVRVMEPTQIGDLQKIAYLAKKVDPNSNPLTRDASGEIKLNLGDKLIEKVTRSALIKYRDLLQSRGMKLDAQRVSRVARYFYGIEDPL